MAEGRTASLSVSRPSHLHDWASQGDLPEHHGGRNANPEGQVEKAEARQEKEEVEVTDRSSTGQPRPGAQDGLQHWQLALRACSRWPSLQEAAGVKGARPVFNLHGQGQRAAGRLKTRKGSLHLREYIHFIHKMSKDMVGPDSWMAIGKWQMHCIYIGDDYGKMVHDLSWDFVFLLPDSFQPLLCHRSGPAPL